MKTKNGIPITDDAGTVWHLIANNITGGGSWPSTVGGLTATGKFGGNSAETPFTQEDNLMALITIGLRRNSLRQIILHRHIVHH